MSRGQVIELLIDWQRECPNRDFLFRSRHSGGYWIEVIEGSGKYEIQATDAEDVTAKILAVLERIAHAG